jgi:hypothetical protein
MPLSGFNKAGRSGSKTGDDSNATIATASITNKEREENVHKWTNAR